MVWDVFAGPFWGDQSDHADRKRVPMQRGAHFAFFDVPCRAPCWAQRGRQKPYEIHDFFYDFPNEGHIGSGHQMYPKDQN